VTTPSQPGNVVLTLTDNLGTVRDLASYNATTGVTSVVNHRVYDSYGNLESSINPSTNQPAAVDCLFGFTGQAFDNATGLQNNVNRWYDAKVGRWASQDPIGFTAGDTNTYRYVGNSPTVLADPFGLMVYKEMIPQYSRTPDGDLWTTYIARYFYAANNAAAAAIAAKDGGTLVALSAQEASLVPHCKGNVDAETNLAAILTVAANTHWHIGPGGMCHGWMNDFLAALPNGFQGGKTSLKVAPWSFLQVAPNWLVGGFSAICRFFGDTYNRPGHWAVRVVFPDGYEVFFDDGWAGTGGMFSYKPGTIPPPKSPLTGGTASDWPKR
jgi:RHS repeat-associated protein